MNLHDLPAEVLPTKAQLQALEANVFADRQQAKWEEGQLDGLPKAIRAEIVKELRTRQLENLADGNRWMLGFLTKYHAFDLPFNASDDDIDAAAARKAKRFAQLLSDISTTCPAEPLTAQGREWCHHHGIRPTELRKAVLGRTPEQMVALLHQACRTMGAEPPKVEHLEGLVARLTDRQWWIRTLRTTATRNLEELARELRQVSSRRGLYISDAGFERFTRRKRANKAFLEAFEAINEDGEIFTLAELSAIGVADPSKRRAQSRIRRHHA